MAEPSTSTADTEAAAPSGGGQVATVVLRASTDNLLDDLERAVDDGVNNYKVCIVFKRCSWDSQASGRPISHSHTGLKTGAFAVRCQVQSAPYICGLLARQRATDVREPAQICANSLPCSRCAGTLERYPRAAHSKSRSPGSCGSSAPRRRASTNTPSPNSRIRWRWCPAPSPRTQVHMLTLFTQMQLRLRMRMLTAALPFGVCLCCSCGHAVLGRRSHTGCAEGSRCA